MTHPRTLVLDIANLVARTSELAKAGALTPERLEAITARVDGHLAELRELLEDEPDIQPLPRVAMRFHGPFGVIDGGLA